jgi:hypothetical protein
MSYFRSDVRTHYSSYFLLFWNHLWSPVKSNLVHSDLSSFSTTLPHTHILILILTLIRTQLGNRDLWLVFLFAINACTLTLIFTFTGISLWPGLFPPPIRASHALPLLFFYISSSWSLAHPLHVRIGWLFPWVSCLILHGVCLILPFFLASCPWFGYSALIWNPAQCLSLCPCFISWLLIFYLYFYILLLIPPLWCVWMDESWLFLLVTLSRWKRDWRVVCNWTQYPIQWKCSKAILPTLEVCWWLS